MRTATAGAQRPIWLAIAGIGLLVASCAGSKQNQARKQHRGTRAPSSSAAIQVRSAATSSQLPAVRPPKLASSVMPRSASSANEAMPDAGQAPAPVTVSRPKTNADCFASPNCKATRRCSLVKGSCQRKNTLDCRRHVGADRRIVATLRLRPWEGLAVFD